MTADVKGMMAALETVNDSLLKMTSTLTQLSRKSFNSLILYELILGPVGVIPSQVRHARLFLCSFASRRLDDLSIGNAVNQ